MTDLTDAERAVARAILARDGETLDTVPEYVAAATVELARTAVAAVRAPIAAEALRWVADSPDRWDGYCCHDHMAAVVGRAADEIESGTEAVPPGDAEAARRARDAAAIRRIALKLDWDEVADLAVDALYAEDVVDVVARWLIAQAAELDGADGLTDETEPTVISQCHVIPRDGCMWLEHYPPGTEDDEYGCDIATVTASDSVARLVELAAGHVCGLAVADGEATDGR